MKIYLDDRREAPSGWTLVTTPARAIELLQTGQVETISLDHDLGLICHDREVTGYDVLTWLEAQVASGSFNFPLPEIRIHSANAAVYKRMQQGRVP